MALKGEGTRPANKTCCENVVVTKNYCYGNVTENVIITLIWMFFYVLKRYTKYCKNIYTTVWKRFNFIKKHFGNFLGTVK